MREKEKTKEKIKRFKKKRKFARVIAYLARAIGQIKSHVQILSGRVWGRAGVIARARMTRLKMVGKNTTVYC